MPLVSPEFVKALNDMMHADLEFWSTFWFWILVAATIVVAVGIFFEGPEVFQAIGCARKTIARVRKVWYFRIRKIELNGWEKTCPELVASNNRHRKWIPLFGLIGWMLVAIGVGGEGFAEYFVNDAETDLREFDHAVLVETQGFANSASAAASIASTFADKAVASSSHAEHLGTQAESLAKGARTEADSFEADIISAKKQATDAESHLREALELSNEVNAELERVRSPRSLSQYSRSVDGIKPFKNTEYVFSGVAADREAIDFLLQIDDFLKSAGWKRGKSIGKFPGINPRGSKEPDFSVSESFTVGVQITVQSPIPPKTLDVMPQSLWPKNVLAAVRLNEAIFGNIMPAPRPTDRQPVVVEDGSSEIVRIDVGRKP